MVLEVTNGMIVSDDCEWAAKQVVAVVVNGLDN